MLLFYVTCKDENEASTIANALLQKKLIACANLFPSRSIYEWRGKREDTQEYIALLKTTEEAADQVEKEITKMHSYDVPCILRIPVVANTEYEKWVKQNTTDH